MLPQNHQRRTNKNTSEDYKKIQNYRYRAADQIGQGNFSKVYKGINSINATSVAIKVIPYSSLTSKVSQQLLKNQINIIKQLNHPNIIKCLDVFSSENNCYIVTEFYERGDLQKMLHRKEKFEEKEIQEILYGIYKGLIYLNKHGIVHRDFKLANIFMDKTGIPKIADFGFAIKATQPFKDINIGSPIYMSPEGMLLHEYGPKTQVWAFGILVYELLHGKTPLCHSRSQKQLRQNIMLPPRFREDISDQFRQLIDICLTIDPKKRIDMKQLAQTQLITRLTHIYEQVNNPRPFLKTKKSINQDLFSTQHSTGTLASKFVKPDCEGQSNIFLQYIHTYQEGLSILQFCRLIHKSSQLTPSKILSNWLLILIDVLQKIKFEQGKQPKVRKLIETITNYHQKYHKYHTSFTNNNGVNLSFSQFVGEVKKLHTKAQQLYHTTNSGKNFHSSKKQQFRTAISHLSLLLRQVELLQKSIESSPPSLIRFVKDTQVERYLQSIKQTVNERGMQSSIGSIFPN